ncbi:hypothetical protein GALMADRAFT_212965 [Galerina marginata CBS 339.88]|uniref:SMODS and SLOG-associating 2TM effector domain-containing protein n=1 Tax=Galerina marginata (strain CBS 339.88) TaxID=685588 RepID=A0A067SZA7_GALM3|nr:hypothetical protein GALMADRAFT_212965 [Galerina marginata CBS 339.88]
MDHDRPQTVENLASSSSSRLSVSHPGWRTQAPSEFRLHGEPEAISTIAGLRQETSSPWSDEKDEKHEARSSRSPPSPSLPPLPEDITPRGLAHPDPRVIPPTLHRLSLRQPSVDWIVPREDRPIRKKSVGERLDPTLLTAIAEKDRYAFKAKLTGFALNAAIGMQVILGALTTGLSVVTTGHQVGPYMRLSRLWPAAHEKSNSLFYAQTQVMTAVLGGIATIVASYLARARGSNEPELSITRVKDLEQFIRDCEAFKMDHGHLLDNTHDDRLDEFRRRFEDLLGNANGERRLSA